MKIFKNGILLFEDKESVVCWKTYFGAHVLEVKGLFENFNIPSINEFKNAKLMIQYDANVNSVYLNLINFYNNNYFLYFSIFPTKSSFNWKKEGF